jgi:hypothetical protein
MAVAKIELIEKTLSPQRVGIKLPKADPTNNPNQTNLFPSIVKLILKINAN